jgi:hypothetical protein
VPFFNFKFTENSAREGLCNMSSLKSRIKSKAILDFSPDVELPLRHRCRNPRCRCKLPIPTDSPRNAFCTRTCFTGYFRSRCLVCERPMERRQENQATCSRPKCKAALRRDRAHFFGKWGVGSGTPEEAEQALRNPIKSGIKTAHETCRPWRQVTGHALSSEVLRLATIGPERVIELERSQKVLVEAHLRASDPAIEAQRETAYVAAVKRFRDHGYGKPVAAPAFRVPTICDWEPAPSIDPASVPVIPEFLCRRKESS